MTEHAKFVQIATCAATNGHSLYALDEDGAVWVFCTYSSGGGVAEAWRKLGMRVKP